MRRYFARSRSSTPRVSRVIRGFMEGPYTVSRACRAAPNIRAKSRALAQKDVGRTFARNVLRAFIAQSTHIDVVQEMLPGTEQDRSDREVQLVDQGGAQILPNNGYAATEADVAATGRSGRLLQSGMNAFGDKAKLRTSRHPERRPRVMRQHEDGRVIGRLVFVLTHHPRATDRTEHVAPKNPC